MTAAVVEALEHSVECRRSRKGLPINVAYEDIRTESMRQLSHELIEGSLCDILSNGPNAQSRSVANDRNEFVNSQSNIVEDIFGEDAIPIDGDLLLIGPSSFLMITSAQPPTEQKFQVQNC